MCLRRKFRCLVPATVIFLCSKARRLCSKCLFTPRIKLLGTSEASERSAIYQERGGGKGKKRRGKGEELEWNGLASHPKGIEVLLIASGNGCRDSTFQICESAILQIFFLLFFLLFLILILEQTFAIKWLLHRNTFLLDYTLCCLFCGLSQVVGPPGTGKTDVAVQIISNLYHNFPEQRTLLVTHSNQVSSSN